MSSQGKSARTTIKLIDRRNESLLDPNSLGQAGDGWCDDILIWKWDETEGWSSPAIHPYGPVPILPSASVLQHATECFEGIKVYRGFDDQVRLFRIRLNCERLLRSSLRVGLPAIGLDDLESVITEFAAVEAEKWLPPGRKGQKLYLRPTHIGTTPLVGVQKPRQSLLYIIATTVAGFTTQGANMKLITSPTDTVRAWPGGFGDAKLGGNYGPTLDAHDKAVRSNFHQVLWLFGKEGYVTEAGASNFFVIWKTRRGVIQLVTAGLENRIILEGVTRRSILDLVRSSGHEAQAWKTSIGQLEPLEADEKDFSIQEIKEAADEGRLLEAFAAGTAVS